MPTRVPFVLLLSLTVVLCSCGKEEGIPDIRTTAGLGVEGSRHVGISNSPDEITVSKGIDTSVRFSGWSTAPLPLAKPNGFVIGARDGKLYFFDRNDSLTHTITMSDSTVPDQLLTTGGDLYAVSVTGTVNAFTREGKLRWRTTTGATLTAQAVIAERVLTLPTQHEIEGVDTAHGSLRWKLNSELGVTAVSYSAMNRLIACALTAGNSPTGDSILFLAPDGSRRFGVGLKGFEITSNLAYAGAKQELLVLGALGAESDDQRGAFVLELKGIESGKPILGWTHPVPFLAGNIAINGAAAFASGFRTRAGDVTSGIAAFSLADTNALWQRRFAIPLIAPVAASDANIYYVSNFESDAIVPSRGVFVTLRAGDGKTVSEKLAPGAEQGLLPAMPMPDEAGRFLLADATRPIVYVFNRSSLRRMF